MGLHGTRQDTKKLRVIKEREEQIEGEKTWEGKRGRERKREREKEISLKVHRI